MADIKLIKQLRDMTQAGFGDCKTALDQSNGDLDAAVKFLREKGLAKAAKKAGAIAAEGAALAVKKDNTVVIAEMNCQTDFAAKNDNFVNLCNEVVNTLFNAKNDDLEEAKKLPCGNETLGEHCELLTGKIGEKITLRRFAKVVAGANQCVGCYQHANKKYSSVALFEGQLDAQIMKNICMHIVAMNPKFIDANQVDEAYVANEKELLIKASKENPKFAGKPEAMILNIVNKQLEKKLSEVCLVNQEYEFDDSGRTVGKVLEENKVKVVKFLRFEVGEGIEKKVSDFAAEVAAQMAH